LTTTLFLNIFTPGRVGRGGSGGVADFKIWPVAPLVLSVTADLLLPLSLVPSSFFHFSFVSFLSKQVKQVLTSSSLLVFPHTACIKPLQLPHRCAKVTFLLGMVHLALEQQKPIVTFDVMVLTTKK